MVDQQSNSNDLMTEQELAKAAEDYRMSSYIGYFFPILKQERKRVVLICTMFCTISFTYAFLRLFKDRIVYSVLDNTETKNWLKLLTFFVTQSLVIFSQNVSSKTNFNDAFRVLTLWFTLFLGVNALLIIATKYIPIQLNDLATDLLFVSNTLTTRGLKVLYPLFIVGNQYIFSSFYVLAEVIGSMMVSFCFMTYVNNNTTENQNKRFVRTLLFFSNISALCAGLLYKSWVRVYEKKPKEDSDIFYFIFPFAAILLYCFVLFLKKILEKEFVENPIVVTTGAPKKKKSKKKIGFKDSLYYMVNSKFLLSMCALSFFYNVTANFLDNANSSGMAAAANMMGYDKSFFATSYKSFDLMLTSFMTCLIIISPLSLLPEKIGVAIFASVPLVVAFLSTLVQLFFAITNFPATGQDNMYPFTSYNPSEKYPIWEASAGTLSQSSIKIAKYAFFDIVKELIAMKIDPRERPLVKGIFDGSITKFGKSVGSLYGILMFYIFGSFDARYYFPITAVIVFFFCILWFSAIRYLGGIYKKVKATGTYIDTEINIDQKA